VLPIVLYNGDAKWTAATDIAALIPKAPGLVAKQTQLGATQGARPEGVENDTSRTI